MLNRHEIARYSKQILLEDVGPAGQIKLQQAKVLIIGAGGLGCPLAQYLNAAGVGTLGIAEFDVVDAANLHRQILYGPRDIGRKKGEVMLERLSVQNPFTNLIWHDEKVTVRQAARLLAAYDFIVDGCDNFETRYMVNDACVQLGKPLIYGSILGYEGQLAVFNYRGGKQLRDIFPEPPDPESVPSCSENGVLATVPGIMGTLMAQATIRLILGYNDHKDHFLLINTLTAQCTRLKY